MPSVADQHVGTSYPPRVVHVAPPPLPPPYSFSAWWFPTEQIVGLLALSLPNVLVSVLATTIISVNLAFAGHVSSAALSGAALGSALMAMSGQVVLNGLCSAVDTLCTQAYGAGQHRMVGLLAWRAAVAFTIPVGPILIVWYNTEPLCILLGLPAEVSADAGVFVWHCAWGILPQLYSQVIRRYLSAQRVVIDQVFPLLFANGVQALVGWALVNRGGMGLAGVGLAYAAAMWAELVGYLAYVYLWRHRELGLRFCPHLRLLSSCYRCGCRWRPLLQGWRDLWDLGAPGVLLLAFKWSAIEACVVQAGWLGSLPLATFVVLKNLTSLAFQLASGLGIASHTLVGNAIGAGRHQEARAYASATNVVSCAAAAVEVLVCLLVREDLARLYTRDPVLTASFADVWGLLLWVLPCDTLQATAVAILRGVGRQQDSTFSNGFAHVVIGLPLGYLLAIPWGWGLEGLVWGYVIGTLLAAAALLWITARLDWPMLAAEAAERRDRERAELEEGAHKALQRRRREQRRKLSRGRAPAATAGAEGGIQGDDRRTRRARRASRLADAMAADAVRSSPRLLAASSAAIVFDHRGTSAASRALPDVGDWSLSPPAVISVGVAGGALSGSASLYSSGADDDSEASDYYNAGAGDVADDADDSPIESESDSDPESRTHGRGGGVAFGFGVHGATSEAMAHHSAHPSHDVTASPSSSSSFLVGHAPPAAPTDSTPLLQSRPHVHPAV